MQSLVTLPAVTNRSREPAVWSCRGLIQMLSPDKRAMTYGRHASSIALFVGLAAGAALCVNWNYAAAKRGPDEPLSTKKVMDRCYVGNQSLLKTVRRDLDRTEPDWKNAEKNIEEIIRLMSVLTRHKPPRGSQEAWNKLVESYVQEASAFQENVREKKLRSAQASLEKIASTCDECHDNHGIQ
jgi:hypothetical protein